VDHEIGEIEEEEMRAAGRGVEQKERVEYQRGHGDRTRDRFPVFQVENGHGMGEQGLRRIRR
jgi:hypothetical protein